MGTAPPLAGRTPWSAPSPSPNRTCPFQGIRLSIRWVRHYVLGNIGSSAIFVGFIQPFSNVMRFVPHHLTAPLRHAVGFPDLGLLRGLCHTSGIGRRLAYSVVGEPDVLPKFT